MKPLLCALCLCCSGMAPLLSAQIQTRNPAALQILKSGYPRAFFFRASEGPPSRANPDYESWDAGFSRLMGIMGKCLDEEVLGRQKNNPQFFSRFKQAHPDQVVLLHLNGNARDPRYQASDFFAGHWIYRQPATMLSDVPAEPGVTTIRVSDARLFRVNMGRYANRNDDIALFGVMPDGPYDWHHSEQVQLLSLDTAKNTIQVRRAQYGTRPRAFKAGVSRAVAHQVEGPWGRNNNLMWYYNYSTHCPKDKQGKTAADRYIDDIARWFGPGGILAAYDGLEFDVLHHRTSGDTNGNGSLDNGVIEGVNCYGLGVVDFVGRLRERMGDRFILQADGALGSGGSNSQRAWGYLNGIESEGWPHLRDWEIHDWSGGLNRHNYWQAFARQPVFNYINHKFNEPVPGGKPGDRRNAQVGFNIHRLVFAVGCFTDAAICYSFAPPAERRGQLGIWDELCCGRDKRLAWLGQALGPAVHLARQAPGRLPTEVTADMISGSVLVEAKTDGLHIRPRDDSHLGFSFSLRGVPTHGPDLYVTTVMKGSPLKPFPPTVARYMELEASTGLNLMTGQTPQSGMCLRGDVENAYWSDVTILPSGLDPVRRTRPERFMSWLGPEFFTSSFYFRHIQSDGVDLSFHIEGTAPVILKSVQAHAHPDAMVRLFEHGIVLANPSLREFGFDLSRIAPGRRFRRIRGSARQDPITNNGSAVGKTVTLGPKDGLFLLQIK